MVSLCHSLSEQMVTSVATRLFKASVKLARRELRNPALRQALQADLRLGLRKLCGPVSDELILRSGVRKVLRAL
jgi:hypothetical protein